MEHRLSRTTAASFSLCRPGPVLGPYRCGRLAGVARWRSGAAAARHRPSVSQCARRRKRFARGLPGDQVGEQCLRGGTARNGRDKYPFLRLHELGRLCAQPVDHVDAADHQGVRRGRQRPGRWSFAGGHDGRGRATADGQRHYSVAHGGLADSTAYSLLGQLHRSLDHRLAGRHPRPSYRTRPGSDAP